MNLNDERNLIDRAKSEPEAFGVIFDMYHPAIYGYILRRTANVELARDIAAETFLKALKNLGRFQWKGISISSWLYRIASNEVMSYYRSRKYSVDSIDELTSITGFEPDSQILTEEVEHAERELEKFQQFLQIQRLLVKLPRRYQEVVALRFFEGMTIREIAGILNKPEGTVKSLISRGLEKLRIRYNADNG